ncbi:MAG: hypothetical protein ABL998_22630 [Planctomycetota bacterium]
MKFLLSPALLCAALFLAASEPAAQRLVLASGHGPTVRVSPHASYSHASRRTWVPGHSETRCAQVWVPAACERVWIEPVFELRVDACGNRVRVQLCAGYWTTIQHPGHYETREQQVWIPGHYASRPRCD